jgi:hypothetical protein
MTITRGIAAAAMLAGLAVGTASTAWADTTMSGHYIVTNTDKGYSVTNDWYVTPCGDGCANVAVTPGGPAGSQARLDNGQWTMDINGGNAHCPDGTVVPNANSNHYTWDPNTLAGTVETTLNVPACGGPAGYSHANDVQLRQAP